MGGIIDTALLEDLGETLEATRGNLKWQFRDENNMNMTDIEITKNKKYQKYKVIN